jgi:copper chaperone NosL
MGGALALAALAACAPQPQPIVYGEDIGAFCRMVIADERYGAELVTTTGRVFKFDSIECLAGYVLAMTDTSAIHSLWVTAFQAPGELMPIQDAFFLHSPTLRSPMGANLTAFRADAITPEAAVNSFGGEVLDWPGVLALMRARGEAGDAPAGRHGGAQR